MTRSLVKTGVQDAVLVVLAVAGFVLFSLRISSEHVDAAADFGITKEEATQRAGAFLVSQGYRVDGLDANARMSRNDSLLIALQRNPGRARAVELLKSEDGRNLPAYLWVVEYRRPDPSRTGLFSLESIPKAFEVSLTSNGAPLAFWSNTTNADVGSQALGNASLAVNRRVLAAALAGSDSLQTAIEDRLAALPDSILSEGLRFERFGENARADEGDPMTALERGKPAILDSLTARRMARSLAPSKAFGDLRWVVDSLYVVPDNPPRRARVELQSGEALHGQSFRIEMTMTATGNLESLRVENRSVTTPQTTSRATLTALNAAAYLLLGLMLFITFVRRIIARLIDVKGALLDALALGILLGLYVILSRETTPSSDMGFWARIGISLLLFSVVGGATALFGFIISSSTESLTRELWPEKLLSGILLRRGDVYNRLVAWALVRGIAVAGVLTGLGVLTMMMLPSAAVEVPKNLLTDRFIRPVVAELALSAGGTYIVLVMLLLGLGSFVFRVFKRKWVTVLVIALVGGALQVGPFGLALSWPAFGASAAAAVVLAIVYLRYDFLTVFVALFACTLIYGLSEGFLVAHTAAWSDALIGVLFIALVGVLGFVGTFSRHPVGNVEQFVPEYITEMAGQERIKRELEIAYQVQASFLPRTMPTVDGLDLAGMCLPANEVGGDYFDFIRMPDGRLAFVVGDVSGKGIQAAFYMTLVKGAVQTLSTTIDSPGVVLQRLNEVFRRNAPLGTFISAIYGIVDPVSRRFTFARAGHNPAILKRGSAAEAEFLRPTGMAVGFADGDLFDDSIREVTLDLAPNDVLVFYTDGFSEAMNSQRELYGDERLLNKVAHMGDRSASGILRSLTEDVHHFIEAAGRADDMTMVVVKMSA